MTTLKRNLILDIDSYKNDHGIMLPENTRRIFSTVVPRKGNKYTSFVKALGHQYIIKRYLQEPLTLEMIDEAEIEINEQGYFFDRRRWEYILQKYNGYLPLEIRAVPEGMIVPVGVAICTIENTDDQCSWLPSYIETLYQAVCWKMTTVASIAYDLYNFLDDMMYKHCGQRGKVNFHLHNFGSRGADGVEAAYLAGMAHLAAGFNGTDCLGANRYIKHYYNTRKAYGTSVTASEHSVMCAWSDPESRDDFAAAEMMINLLEHKITHKIGIPLVSIVSDTYDIYRFTEDYLGDRLKERIIGLGQRGGKVVVRPDSGDPLEVCIDVIKILMRCFGYTLNQNGYKVLPPYIGVIQGDGINNDTIRIISQKLDAQKISLENIIFGMGGGLTHEAGRDEFSFSMKVTARFDGTSWHDLYKDPVTDIAKRSLKGKVSTYLDNTAKRIISARIDTAKTNPELSDLMTTVYYNGELTTEYSFEEVLAFNQRKYSK